MLTPFERTDPRCQPNRDFPYARQDGDDCIHVCCLCEQERFRSIIYDEDESGPWLHRCWRDDPDGNLPCKECIERMCRGIAEAAAASMVMMKRHGDPTVSNIMDYWIARHWLGSEGYIGPDEAPEAWLEGK